MLKKISTKIKDMFNKESNSVNNKVSNTEDNNNEVYLDDESSINYLGSDEYKIDMKRAELRYKFLPNSIENSSLKNEYVNYVEEKLSTLTVMNMNSLEIESWDEWLSNELNSSFNKIKI